MLSGEMLPPVSRIACLACVLSFAAFNNIVVAADDATQRQFDPNIDLPDSAGRELVLRACTKCHELKGLEAYKGYWDFAQWKAMVEGMVKNGALLQPVEQDVVAEYLSRHFGPDSKKQEPDN